MRNVALADIPPSPASGVFPVAAPALIRCFVCGESKEPFELEERHQVGFATCLACVGKASRSNRHRTQVARQIVANAERGRIGLLAAANESGLALRTIEREAKASGNALAAPSPGDEEPLASSFWSAASVLALPYFSQPRTWRDILVHFDATCRWDDRVCRDLIVYLELEEMLTAVRVDEDTWAWVRS